MSNEHTDQHRDKSWESELSRGLGERARDLDGADRAPFTFEQVRSRARRVKRNRRLAAAGTVLAVAAVVVPVSVLAGDGLAGRTDRDLPPATQSSDPTGDATRAVDGGGSGLGVDYLEGRTWVRSDGEPVELPAAYSTGVVIEDLLVGVRNDDDTGIKTLEIVDADGEVTETVRGVLTDPVVNDEGTAMTFVTTEGDLVVHTADDSRTVARGLGGSAWPLALDGECDADDNGCRLYLDLGDAGKTPVQVLSADGSMRDAVTADPAPIGLTDAAGDVVAAQLSFADGGACFALYDVPTADYTYRTCDYSLLDLDPEGAQIAVSHPYLDGPGNAWVAILGSDHNEVTRLDPDGIVSTQAWSQDGSLLVTVFERDQQAWSIWRLRAGSDPEPVVTGGVGTEETSRYRLLR